MMKIETYYENVLVTRKMLWIEALVAAVCGYAAWAHLGGLHGFDVNRVVDAFLTISATLLGFIIAALSILTAVVDRQAIVNLRKTGHYDNLLANLYWASVLFMAALVSSIICLFLVAPALLKGVAVAAFFLTFALLVFIDAGRKFLIVMRLMK